MNMGGQETFIMNVFRRIDREKYRFDFLCSGDGNYYYAAEIEALGGKIFHLGNDRHGINPIYRWLTRRRKFKRFLQDNPYDVVHIHTANAISYLHAKAALDAGVKRVVMHSHNSFSYGRAMHRHYKKGLSRLGIIKAACGREAAEWLFGSADAEIIYNGIDLDAFRYNADKRNALRGAFEVEADTVVLGHVGRFDAQKNHAFLIRIFDEYVKANANACFVLVGAGDLSGEIKAQAAGLGLSDKVLFLGVRPDVADLLNMMDVFVMPSLYEGLPLTLIEAQANGLPVLLSDTVTEAAVISQKAVRLSLGDGFDRWCKAINRLAGSGHRAEPLLTSDSKKYDIGATVLQLEELYKRGGQND